MTHYYSLSFYSPATEATEKRSINVSAHINRGWGCPPFNIVPTFLRDNQKTRRLLLSHLESPWQHLYTIRSINTNTHSWFLRNKGAQWAFPIISLCACVTAWMCSISTPFITSANQPELIRQQRLGSVLEIPSPPPHFLLSPSGICPNWVMEWSWYKEKMGWGTVGAFCQYM